MTFEERLSTFFEFSWEEIDGPLISSLMIMAIILVLAIVIGIMARRQDPTKPSKGLLFLAEWGYEKLEGFVDDTMGPEMHGYLGFFCVAIPYTGLAFLWGLTGLPSVIDWLAAPLSLAIVMFVLIHFTSIRYSHWGYFHRYIDPIPIFLPVNLVTMWTPIISVTMRMFGNCLSGTIIIGLVQWAIGMLEASLFGFLPEGAQGIILSPIPSGILNLYFGLFSAYIQTTVYAFLCALWIAQEKPSEEEKAALPVRSDMALSAS